MDSIFFRLLVSLVAGFLLGLERQMHRQPAGLKTHILICTGSSLLMILSLILAGGINIADLGLLSTIGLVPPSDLSGDPGRLAAQVVSGIGFLGGGAIIRQGFNIKGLTTAATIWVSAAIGLAIGLGAYGAALITLVCVLATLYVMERFESKLFPVKNVKTLYAVYDRADIDITNLEKQLLSLKIAVDTVDMARSMDSGRVKVTFQAHVPPSIDHDALCRLLGAAGPLVRMELTSNEKPSR